MPKALFILLVTTSAFAASRRCGFSIDVTISVDASARHTALSRIAAGLPDLAADLHCTTITISTFTDQGWFTPVQHYTIPADQHRPCIANLTTAQRVLQPFASYQALQEQRCNEQHRREDERNNSARNAVIQQVATALRQIHAVPSRCTDIATHLALLQHLRGPHDVDFVITDGQQTCTADRRPASPPVTFILLPPKEHGSAIPRGFRTGTYLLPAQLDGAAWWRTTP